MRRRSVLLADSHSPMLDAVRTLLGERFDVVVMVADERSMFEAIERLQPALLVVDASLPRKAAGNTIALIRDRFPELKMIALSSFDDKAVSEKLLNSGALAVVVKSSAVNYLGPAVDLAFSGSALVSISNQSN